MVGTCKARVPMVEQIKLINAAQSGMIAVRVHIEDQKEEPKRADRRP